MFTVEDNDLYIGNSFLSHQINIKLDRSNNHQLCMSIEIYRCFFSYQDRHLLRRTKVLSEVEKLSYGIKNEEYGLHFLCLICTFMRQRYRRLVVSITLYIIDGIHQKDKANGM